MRNHAPHLSTLLAVAYAVACASPGPAADTARSEPQESVPATAPNLRPPTLDDDLVPDGRDLVSTTVLSVTFAVGATQTERQAAIDSVDGTVIGGLNRGGHDGSYYVRVEGDGTIETIYEIAHTLNALPQVELAGPCTVFRSEYGRR